MSAEEFLNKVDRRLDDLENVKPLPPFSDLTDLVKGRGFQEELSRWSKLLSDETNRYTKIKRELSEIKKWRTKNLDDIPSSLTSKVSSKLDEFKNRYRSLVDTAKRRIRTIERLIESVRSLQSHSNPS